MLPDPFLNHILSGPPLFPRQYAFHNCSLTFSSGWVLISFPPFPLVEYFLASSQARSAARPRVSSRRVR
jgi:hypothetical protein